MEEKSLKEVDAKEFMLQIAISQLSYNQVDIDKLLVDDKFKQVRINDYIEIRESSHDKDLKIKGGKKRGL